MYCKTNLQFYRLATLESDWMLCAVCNYDSRTLIYCTLDPLIDDIRCLGGFLVEL